MLIAYCFPAVGEHTGDRAGERAVQFAGGPPPAAGVVNFLPLEPAGDVPFFGRAADGSPPMASSKRPLSTASRGWCLVDTACGSSALLTIPIPFPADMRGQLRADQLPPSGVDRYAEYAATGWNTIRYSEEDNETREIVNAVRTA